METAIARGPGAARSLSDSGFCLYPMLAVLRRERSGYAAWRPAGGWFYACDSQQLTITSCSGTLSRVKRPPMSFFVELKRRNVIRVAVAYVVAAWLVIQVVETIFPAFGFGDAAIRTVVIVLAIGLVPVVIFAWAFELTPDGLKREKDVDRSQSIAPRTGKRLDRVIMVVLALALGYFAFDKFVLAPQRTADLQAGADRAAGDGRRRGA